MDLIGMLTQVLIVAIFGYLIIILASQALDQLGYDWDDVFARLRGDES